MNQQLKDGDCSVWQLCPLTHTLGHLNYGNPGETSQAVLSWRQQQALAGTDGMGWIRISWWDTPGLRAGKMLQEPSPGWRRRRVPTAQLRSLEAPAGSASRARL